MRSGMVVRSTSLSALAALVAAPFLLSCGSKTDASEQPVRSVRWVKGDCGIPSQASCVDIIDVSFAACALYLANGKGVSEPRLLPNCKDLVAAVLHEDIPGPVRIVVA